MAEHLYIVIWKNSRGAWQPEAGGVFSEQRLAENLVECKKAAGETYEFAIVEGSLLTPETEEEAAVRLGQF